MNIFYQTDDMTGGGAQEAQLSVVDRIISVFTEPRKVFEYLKTRPEFLIPLLISVLLVGIFTYSNRQAFTDLRIRQVQMNEKMPPEVKEKQLEAMENLTSTQEIIYYIVIPVVFSAIFYFLLGFIFYVVGTFILGGQASYPQVQSVYGYSSLILSILGVVLAWILILVSGTAQVSTSLAVILPEEDAGTLLYQLLNLVDIVYFYWIYVFGLGLSVVYNWTVKKGILTVAILYFGYGIIKALAVASF